MTKRSEMSALDAARKILQDAEAPLHYQEITKRVLSAGLWKTNGKTPAATINAQLATNIKKNGPASAFRRAGRGIFALTAAPTDSTLQSVVERRKKEKRAKSQSSTRPLVLGYLERIASSAFSEFPQQITDLVHGKHGVYALYKGDRLYYVGLATNLRNRIRQHLKDKHAGKWNRFSLYLVRKVEHIKELESMILRIADPTGNSTRGGLPGADDLWGRLHKTIREEQDRQIQKLFGVTRKAHVPKRKGPARKTPKAKTRTNNREPALAPYRDKGIKELRATFRKQTLTARVKQDGTIVFNDKTYNSPSMAGAVAVQRKTCNGWTFWKYEESPDNWVPLDSLRKG
jgi:hypothetical protein